MLYIFFCDVNRARVKAMKGSDTCVVQFVDFGNCGESQVSTLKQLTADFTAKKALAIRCCLKVCCGTLLKYLLELAV